MTIQESIDYFSERNQMCLSDSVQEAENEAIKALNKQIPKRMEDYYCEYDIDLKYRCPVCGEVYDVFYRGKPYCMYCGQKILWGTE